MGVERMTQKALGRAYRMRVTKTPPFVLFEVFAPNDRSGSPRAIASLRVSEVDFLRMMKSWRAKYKVPAENIEYVGFAEGDARVGKVALPKEEVKKHAEDRAQVEGSPKRTDVPAVPAVPGKSAGREFPFQRRKREV